MRVFKVLVVTAAVLLGLVAVLITAINVIPGEKFKPLINSAVSSATGRNLTIGGDLNIDLFSTFTFSASDVRFSNPAWGSRPEMFSGGTIEGELALLPLLNGVLDFSLVLQAPDLLLETDARGRGNWQMGEEQAAEEAAVEKDGDFRLRPLIRELRFEQVNLAYLDGKTSNKNSAVFETILLASRGNQVNIELDGEVNGIPVLLSGGVDSAADTIPDQAAAFTLAGKAGEIQLDAKGMLSALSATADVDLLVKLDAPSLAAFTPLTAQELPEYGPFSALIQLSGSDGDYAVTDLTANLDAEALSAAVKGSISALSPVSGISLAVNLETARLPEIVEQAKVEVPVALPAAVKARADISGSLEELAISHFQIDIQDQGLEAAATGRVENAVTREGITADVALKTESLANLSKYAKTELPGLGPLEATAKVKSQAGTYGLSDIKAELKAKDIQVKAEGSIGDVMELKAIDATVQAALSSLASLNRLTNQELPDSGPVSLDARLSNEEGLDAPSTVSATLKGEGVKAVANGRVADLLAIKGITAAVNVEADSLRQLARLAGEEVDRDDPIKLKGDLSIEANSYRLTRLQGSLAESEVSGEMAFTQPGKGEGRPKLTGKVHVTTLDLGTLLPESEVDVEIVAADGDVEKVAETSAKSPPDDSDGSTKAKIKSEKVFPTDPLPFETLNALDADIAFTADEILTKRILLGDVTTEFTLENGSLRAKPIKAQVGDGTLEASISVDAQRPPATLSVTADMEGGTHRYYGGTYNMNVDLAGTGNSVAALMAGLDGQLIFDARDLTLKKSAMTNFGRGLADSLNPFDKESESSKLVCAIMRFDIKDGIANADDQLVAQMTNVTWFGGGEINLKTEAIELGAESKPRKGLGLQALGGLSNLVVVGGTLANPRIQLDPVGVVKKYGDYYLTVVTGGLYLVLKGLWDKSEANSDVCAEILKKEKQDDEKETGRTGPLRSLFKKIK